MILQKGVSTTVISKLLILGSGSIARKELLKSVGLSPNRIERPEIDESLRSNEKPISYVKRIAQEKANSIITERDSFLITADTIVVARGQVLLKTSDEIIARNYLKLLSGRKHIVYTAFCVRHNAMLSLNFVKTSLKMKLLTKEDIGLYVASKEWQGCAGAYSIQGRAKCFFPFISGCFTNVIGLPIPKLISVLKGMGFYQKQNEKRSSN